MNTTAPIDVLSFASGAMCFDPRRISMPAQALFEPTNPSMGAVSVKVGGRQSAWFVSGDFGQAVLRHYRRGGLVARVSRQRYIWTGEASTRSFAEFRIMQYLQGRGLNVPAPLAAAYWRSGLTYRAAILIERVTGVSTLAETLGQPQAVAQAVFAMHEAGVWHADLNAYNILMDGSGRAWLIDFDRARRMPMTTKLRQSNLFRLRRSLLKVAGGPGLRLWQQIDQAYAQLAP